MVPARLNVVTIGVRDLARVRSFYQSLGWRGRPREGAFTRFDLAGAALVLFPLDTLADVVGVSAPAQASFSGTTHAIVAETAEELDTILASAASAGGQILSKATRRPWGSRTGYFADPELNVWEVVLLPGATFDDTGSLIWPGPAAPHDR
ncbi:VOC family protein [Mycobacterium sherrisii]|uniref:VOC domain-containing protein n=1 Tax=Mycobacterium sherrisii TaxID=243061 RepID=A0A1E3SNY1_9MYCO|nr:VOC family protein [Mycobacterium sherrisii]MCV7032325.1 VOC family protein [Mycobacterium sherrisii]ODR03861.1 hypothetical protein BHQ21_19755 [Mycobacterium sherrisii]ORW74575.1 hypothetical protein AWC25_16590 [Mycobacterium sherrisii]